MEKKLTEIVPSNVFADHYVLLICLSGQNLLKKVLGENIYRRFESVHRPVKIRIDITV